MPLAVGNPTYLTDLPKGLVAWHSRDSAGAITGVGGTETGVLRIDGIPIRNGYHYEFVSPQVNVNLSAGDATAIGTVRLRFSTSGNATIASGQMPYGGFYRTSQPTSNANTNIFNMVGEYHASADGTLSVILTVIRTAGTSTVGVFASAANPCSLFVYERSLFPATSGVDL